MKMLQGPMYVKHYAKGRLLRKKKNIKTEICCAAEAIWNWKNML